MLQTSVKVLCTILFVLITATQLCAQGKKAHYIIHDPQPGVALSVYEEALNKKELDNFRFVKERRKIYFVGTQTYVELLSGEELLSQYGKPISPVNISDPSKAQRVEFILDTQYKAIKEKF